MLRITLMNGAPQQSSSALTDAISAALGVTVDELMAQSLYCLASQSSVQRHELLKVDGAR